MTFLNQNQTVYALCACVHALPAIFIDPVCVRPTAVTVVLMEMLRIMQFLVYLLFMFFLIPPGFYIIFFLSLGTQ